MGITIKHDSNYGNLEIALKNLDKKIGKVGWFENSKYEDGTPVASVAVTQEYGDPSRYIPARPFMTPTIINKRNDWVALVEKGTKRVLKGDMAGVTLLELLGKQAVVDIQKTITQIFSPPLSPVTIYARLHRKSDKKTIGKLDKPLIDTGIMFNTITNTVESE